jgi:hypothetical protein
MGVRIGNLVHASQVLPATPTLAQGQPPAAENLPLF